MRRLAAVLVAALVAAPSAHAGTALYKWVDAQGKVQYSDRPPKNFKGEVTLIPGDEAPPPAPAAPRPPAAAPASSGRDAAKPPADIASRRRATRVRLQAGIDRAQARLEAARKALEDEKAPNPDNTQVIQQRVANGSAPQAAALPNSDPTQVAATGGGMHGMGARSNCRPAPGAQGKAVICPTLIPKPEHLERIERLEEEVRRAEEALADAERAYRRGVD